MAEELEFTELPTLELGITISKVKGRPVLILKKQVNDIQKIRLLIEILMREQYLPCRILVQDKLRFFSRLKKDGLI